MIGPIAANVFSNATMANLAQDTAWCVAIETGLKSLGRPGFILIDNDISPETKRYAATKEFLYQITCLVVYLAIIPRVFKNGSFKLAKNYMFKNKPEFAKFKNAKEYLNYFEFASKSLKNRQGSLNKVRHEYRFRQELVDDLMKNDKPEKYPLVKGVIELGSMVGSVLGLAILAPEVSHMTIHPLMRLIGMEKKPAKQPKEEKAEKVDIKA